MSSRRVLCVSVPTIALVALLAAGGAVLPAAQAPAAQDLRVLTPDQVTAELALFEAALTELHPSFARGRRQETLARFMAGVRTAATGPMSAIDLYRVLAPFAAVVQDGHTTLALPGDTTASWKLLPLRVWVDPTAGTLWTLGPESSGIPAGSRIEVVNNIPAAKLLAAIAPTIPRDGDAVARVAWALGQGFRFSQAMAALFGSSETYQLDIVGPGQSGAARRVVVAGATLAELRAGAPAADGDFSLTFERDGAVGVMRIAAFSAEIQDRMTAAFQTLHERKTRALVVDLRDNPGGRDELGKVLLAHLAAAPFSYYRSLRVLADPRHPAFSMVAARRAQLPEAADGSRSVPSPNLGLQQPVAPVFAGPVVVLINAGTFSTAAEFVSIARATSRVTLVGEETGGNRCGNNSGVVVPVTLPHSQLRLAVPLVEYTLEVPCEGDRRGVRPDHPVARTLSDLLQGRDRQMESALDAAVRAGGR